MRDVVNVDAHSPVVAITTRQITKTPVSVADAQNHAGVTIIPAAMTKINLGGKATMTAEEIRIMSLPGVQTEFRERMGLSIPGDRVIIRGKEKVVGWDVAMADRGEEMNEKEFISFMKELLMAPDSVVRKDQVSKLITILEERKMAKEIWVIERRPQYGGHPQYLAVEGSNPSECLQCGGSFFWCYSFASENVIKFYNRESAAMCLGAIMLLFHKNYSYRDLPDGLRFGDPIPEIVSHSYMEAPHA